MFLPLLLACSGGSIDRDTARKQRDTAVDSGAGDTAESDPPETLDCKPDAVVHGTEGEVVSVEVRCSTGASVDRFELGELPGGATWDAASSTLTWTPGLDAAGHYEVEVIARRGDHEDEGELDLWIADAWSAADNVPVDPLTYEEEYGLPVLHLERPPGTNSDSDVTSSMVYRGETYTIGLQYRGAASLYYPKKSYKLSFASDQEFRDDETGYPKRRSVVLTTLFDDPSYIRQKLTFDTWNALRPTRRQVASAFVVVYINGAYEGLYLLGDHIDKEWWEDQGYTEEGNLYKSVDHSADWYDTTGSGWEKKDGDPPDDFSDLLTLQSWVATSSADDFDAGIDDHIPMDDISDWWVMCVGAWIDDSCGKNAYMYHDKLTDEKFRHVPWDFNASWGQEWETTKTSASTDWDFAQTNNLFNRSLQSPTLGARLVDDLHTALAGPMSAAEQEARVDAYVVDIEPSLHRDWEKWSASFQDYFGWGDSPGTPSKELDYVRTWVSDRNTFLSTRYP